MHIADLAHFVIVHFVDMNSLNKLSQLPPHRWRRRAIWSMLCVSVFFSTTLRSICAAHILYSLILIYCYKVSVTRRSMFGAAFGIARCSCFKCYLNAIADEVMWCAELHAFKWHMYERKATGVHTNTQAGASTRTNDPNHRENNIQTKRPSLYEIQ